MAKITFESCENDSNHLMTVAKDGDPEVVGLDGDKWIGLGGSVYDTLDDVRKSALTKAVHQWRMMQRRMTDAA